MFARAAAVVAAVSVALAAASCAGDDELILATTTSLQDSGLLDALVPRFEDQTGYTVKTIAVGSGAALRLGKEGEVDVILAHSPDEERAFMAADHGVNRRPVMHNDFVIVGPPADPAEVRGLGDAAEAFRRIAAAGERFLSRGDKSGTHAKELAIWRAAGAHPSGGWYEETGVGMGQTLLIAEDRRAYTLSDRGTYLAQRENVRLELLVEGDPALVNPYHVMQVNPEKSGRINGEAAAAFARFITSGEAQEIIGRYGVEHYGQPLFVPDAYVESTPGTPSAP